MAKVMRGTLLTRVAYDEALIPGAHFESDLGVRNIAGEFTIPPPEPEGVLVCVVIDESHEYTTAAPTVDQRAEFWATDSELLLNAWRPVSHLVQTPIVYAFNTPEPTRITPDGSPMYHDDLLGGGYTFGALPIPMEIRSGNRRRFHGDETYSSRGIFLPPITQRLQNVSIPKAIIWILDGSDSMRTQFTPEDSDPSVLVNGGVAYEPGLWRTDFRGLSVIQFLADDDRYSDVRMGVYVLFKQPSGTGLHGSERWMRYMADVFYLVGTATGP